MINSLALHLFLVWVFGCTNANSVIQSTLPEELQPWTLSIAAVGDVMLGTTYPSSPNYLPPFGPDSLLAYASGYLQSADLAFGNSEGTFLDGKGTLKQCSNPSLCYAFKSPEVYAMALQRAGFDLMSIANNHFGDFGPEGRASTIEALHSAGIKCAGWLELPFATIEVKGKKIGLLAFAPNTGTCDINDYAAIDTLIKMARPQVDLLIISFHGGAEGNGREHVPKKNEIFYGENRGDVHRFAHHAIDNGADLIIGHGPHVPRAVELYKGKFIAYSLGNFCTYGRFNLSRSAGLAPLLTVVLDENGNFKQGQLHSFLQLGEGGPVPDPSNSAALKIKELTFADFPDTPISISDSGAISLISK